MIRTLRKNWFMLGLVAVALAVVMDSRNILVAPGLWLKQHGGPDGIIVLIFFLSGLALDIKQIKEGIADVKGTLLALLLIFLAAPILAFFFSLLPMETGVIVGLFLVAAMPTTLSSGVVMTGSGGGNMAHSLVITIVASSLAVITIPRVVSLLLGLTGTSREVEIDQIPIMIKIATLVLLPLVLGISGRRLFGSALRPILPYTATCNQLGILTMVWMALCSSRPAIISGLGSIVIVILVVFFFHLLLVLAGIAFTQWCNIPKGRRESVIFMGGQKTLPLSVIIQVSLFPEFGIALVVCVIHHIVHLIMDAYLVTYLKNKE